MNYKDIEYPKELYYNHNFGISESSSSTVSKKIKFVEAYPNGFARYIDDNGISECINAVDLGLVNKVKRNGFGNRTKYERNGRIERILDE